MMQSISRLTLHRLHRLKTLEMKQNEIEGINTNAFSENWRLEIIYISNNMLTSKNKKCFIANVLEKLETLNLANNQISSIHQDIFLLSDLKRFNLSHNQILTIDDMTLIDFKQNQGLLVHLSFNRIERVIIRNGFDISGHNFHFNLEGNPLICDCHVTELKQKMQENGQSVC